MVIYVFILIFERGLCNYYSSSEDDDENGDGDNDIEVIKSNSNKKRDNTPKSPVINIKNRQRDDDRKKERRNWRESRDSSSRFVEFSKEFLSQFEYYTTFCAKIHCELFFVFFL